MKKRVGRSHELGRTGFASGLSIVLEDGTGKGVLATGVRPTIQESGKSDMEQTLRHIFDVPMASETTFTMDNQVDIGSLQSYLQTRLCDISNLENDVTYAQRDGVSIVDSSFVNGVVVMDGTSLSGEVRLTKGSLVVESQAIFSSIRANACVCEGKWMYEAILETAGIQQLGWATRSCSFTREEGVGDSKDSYAYDGKRVRKWSESCQPFGQPWVTGDVIGCCIDLHAGEISFYRNGNFLGVAFDGVGSVEPKLPYYPAISLSQGERCELNFGARPFKYPIKGFFAIQASPVIKDGDCIVSAITRTHYLLGCLQRLVQLDSHEIVAAMTPVERLRRLKPLSDDSFIVGEEICKPLISLLSDSSKGVDGHTVTYLTWGALVPFLMEIYGVESPHDGPSVDRALDLLLPALDSRTKRNCIAQVMEALAFGCRTSPITLVRCPHTGSYPYLALACHLLHRDEVMLLWCRSEDFESCLEGLLTRKGPNKFDLGTLLPIVWWPGSREDLCSESNMRQTASALSKTIEKVEELQWQLCHYLLDFVPHQSATDINLGLKPPPEPVFKIFVKHLMNKNKGAARNIPPPGLSDNSVLVAVYTVLLRLLSEGLDASGLDNGKGQDCPVGFLHRGGKQHFKSRMFLDSDTCANDFSRLGGTFSHLCKTHVLDEEDYEDVEWEEGFMDGNGNGITHSGNQKPCCCSGLASNSIIGSKSAIRILRKRFNIHLDGVIVRSDSDSPATDVSNRSIFNEEVEDTPSSSGRGGLGFGSLSFQHVKKPVSKSYFLSDGVREDELLDTMVLLYHLGVAPNFKQASYYLQHQLQAIAQLDETDRQIHVEQASGDFSRQLKEARTLCREDLIDCVRQSIWYRVSLFSKWKQRGMYATCMWISQLLLLLSKKDVIFSFVPEYYVETLLDCFHALRRSDPPFVSPMALLQQGLSSLVTFLANHFNDTRIANSDIRDVLLQSISVLVQYKEHLVAFECNSAAVEVMPAALLSAFDSRFWIPVTNILLRLCKGSGFGASKSSTHGESCSPRFQCLLRDCCMADEKLFSGFLNRLFNTLNWTISEFSVSLKEMQEHSDQHQGPDLQQRKCTIMFELSCNLERVLEFFTHELPQAFLSGPEMNLLRLCEVLMFVLNYTTSSADALLFDSIVRQQGQSPEKMNRAMILAPLVGIILNLFAAQISPNLRTRHDLAEAIANADISSAAIANFNYLLEYNWASAFKGDPSLPRLCQLRDFTQKLKAAALPAMREELEEDLRLIKVEVDHAAGKYSTSEEEKDDICSICYVCEVNTIFFPCKHKSCWRCISRHLLNSQRCFFCNGTVQDLRMLSAIPSNGNSQFRGPGAPNGLVAESGLLVKIDSP